jgi:AraC-like DNA-binding protein
MHLLMHLTESANLLDALALASSLLILLFLMRNRRQYGSLVIDGKKVKAASVFSDEIYLQMMSQQSQMAYDNLKRSLTQEFESLWMLGDSALRPGTTNHKTDTPERRRQPAVKRTSQHRRQRYQQAEKMLSGGADASQIARRCGLGEGEMELLQGLQQLAQGRRSGSA